MPDELPSELTSGLAEVVALARSAHDSPEALARAADLAARFPRHVQPLLQWAVLLRLAGMPGATDALARCLALEPRHPLANRLMGEVLLDQGLATEAVPRLEIAVQTGRDDSRGWWLLAKARHRAGDPAGALLALAEGRRQWPHSAELVALQGALHASAGAWHAAVDALRAAATADPRASSLLGDALMQVGRPAQAYLAYRHAERRLGGCPATGSRALFASQFVNGRPMARLMAHQRWASRYVAAPSAPTPVRDPDPDRPLRVGFASPRLRTSSAAFLLFGLIDHWPAGLVLNCYAEQDAEDPVAERIRSRCERWVDTRKLSDAALADSIAGDEVDILIDLAGHTPGNRLPALARRPAPVMLSWLDYCDTTGSDSIDGLITDSTHTPRHDGRHFSERLLRLDPLRFCYQPPAGLPDVAPAGRRSARAPVFGAFHRFAKLSPAVLAAWARLLHALPEARLVIRNDALALAAEHDLHRQRLAAAGLPIERVELKAALAHREYLAAYEEIDVALDTFPYNGGVTTLEALVMGRPVVTFAGATLISRQSAAILRAMGLQELIADGPDHYVRLAAELAADTGRLGTLSRGLRERMLRSAVCDAPGFARRFGALLREAWRARCRGEAIGEST